MYGSYPPSLSAQAIAGHGRDHPHDPADLLRCINYWNGRSTAELQQRMAGRSVHWDRLLPHWDELVALLKDETESATDGRAPRTYVEMRRLLDDGVRCDNCGATGRGDECRKCKGTGRRSGGRCRAEGCFGGAHFCPTCWGNGYTKTRKAS